MCHLSTIIRIPAILLVSSTKIRKSATPQRNGYFATSLTLVCVNRVTEYLRFCWQPTSHSTLRLITDEPDASRLWGPIQGHYTLDATTYKHATMMTSRPVNARYRTIQTRKTQNFNYNQIFFDSLRSRSQTHNHQPLIAATQNTQANKQQTRPKPWPTHQTDTRTLQSLRHGTTKRSTALVILPPRSPKQSDDSKK